MCFVCMLEIKARKNRIASRKIGEQLNGYDLNINIFMFYDRQCSCNSSEMWGSAPNDGDAKKIGWKGETREQASMIQLLFLVCKKAENNERNCIKSNKNLFYYFANDGNYVEK